MFKKKKKKDISYRVITTRELLKRYLISKLPKQKRLLQDDRMPPENLPLLDSEISYLAIVLDGKVEDIMRAQNRLAALLLSGPEFVEFHPKHENIIIGKTKYVDGEFIDDVEK
jgi:hypothetical protein